MRLVNAEDLFAKSNSFSRAFSRFLEFASSSDWFKTRFADEEHFKGYVPVLVNYMK